MSIDDVSKSEELLLKQDICPDCLGTGFLEGPCGGGSVNVMCANEKCQAKFNMCGPPTPQRLSYGKSKIKLWKNYVERKIKD